MQKQGYDVLLVGRVLRASAPMEDRPYAVKRMRLIAEKGALFYAAFNFRLFWLLLFRKCTLLVSNDLDTLLPNFLVSKIRRKPLVYDAHEYFTEVPELIHRPRIQRIWERIERFCLPKVKMALTVNNSIREKYEEKYGTPFKVVRNISPRYFPDAAVSREALGLPAEKSLLIMQGAGLNVDRGVEEAIRAMEFVSSATLIIVGDGDVIPEMKTLVKEKVLSEKVLFFGKRPYRELMKYTEQATLGLSFDQPTNPNYLFSLPNKIFDYIHTGTPILCSDLVEVKKIVLGYQLGEIVTNFSPEALAEQIERVLNNPEQLRLWKENCKTTAAIEHWDNEVQQLDAFYPKI